MLDTSILIDPHKPADGHVAISVVSLAELQLGVLVAANAEAQARRLTRFSVVAANFPSPLPVDARVAREWGTLQAAVKEKGGNPRARQADLIIAATALAHDAAVLTRNPADFKLVADQVTILTPADLPPIETADG